MSFISTSTSPLPLTDQRIRGAIGQRFSDHLAPPEALTEQAKDVLSHLSIPHVPPLFFDQAFCDLTSILRIIAHPDTPWAHIPLSE